MGPNLNGEKALELWKCSWLANSLLVWSGGMKSFLLNRCFAFLAQMTK